MILVPGALNDSLMLLSLTRLSHRRTLRSWRCYSQLLDTRRAPEPSSAEVAQLLTKYAAHAPLSINLATLLSFGRPLTPESILSSVQYALSEIPRRLATRVRSLESLPFIVGTNPYVAKTLNAYRESFQLLATYPHVGSLDENAKFVSMLAELVRRHANDIPTMAKGCVASELVFAFQLTTRIWLQLPRVRPIHVTSADQHLP